MIPPARSKIRNTIGNGEPLSTNSLKCKYFQLTIERHGSADSVIKRDPPMLLCSLVPLFGSYWAVDETLWAQLLTLLGDILSQQTHDPLTGIYMYIHACNNNENEVIDLRVGRGIWKDLPGGKGREKYSKHIVYLKTPRSNYWLSPKAHFTGKDVHKLRVKAWKSIYQANGIWRQTGIVILISDIIDFKSN